MGNYKELLELAAKAADIKIDKSPYNGGGFGNNGFDMLGNLVVDWHNNIKWNPINDDGDALRLRNKLGMILICNSDHVYVEEFQHSRHRVSIREMYMKDLPDGRVSHESVNKAVRLAITKAAAEVWRQRE